MELGCHTQPKTVINQRKCDVCNCIEDKSHFLLHCRRFETQRDMLFSYKFVNLIIIGSIKIIQFRSVGNSVLLFLSKHYVCLIILNIFCCCNFCIKHYFLFLLQNEGFICSIWDLMVYYIVWWWDLLHSVHKEGLYRTHHIKGMMSPSYYI